MRSMNMIQLFGGVAVAGVVAAGATAFTASGVTQNNSLASGVTAGGSTNVTVTTGAKLMAAKMTQPAANPDQITGVVVDVFAADGTTSLGGSTVVKAKITGTGGDAVSAAWTAACTRSTDTWTCVLPGSTYFTAVSAVDIGVIPGA